MSQNENQTQNSKPGMFEWLNFIIDHESLDFVGYEFEGKEFEIIEEGCEQSLFRMDVDKKSGEITVYSAYSQDFDVMEEVTHYFDTKKLMADVEEYMKNNDDIDNQGEPYLKYCKLIDEGWDCEHAISKCYL